MQLGRSAKQRGGQVSCPDALGGIRLSDRLGGNTISRLCAVHQEIQRVINNFSAFSLKLLQDFNGDVMFHW